MKETLFVFGVGTPDKSENPKVLLLVVISFP